MGTSKDQEQPGYLSPRLDTPRLIRNGLLFTALLMSVFLAGVYFSAAYGGSWVDSLDEGIGEVVAERARRLEAAGHSEEAAVRFQEALAARFDDPLQRVRTSHDFGKLLLKLEAFDEAIEVAKVGVDLDGENGEAFSIWHKALEQMALEAEALELTKTWYAWSRDNDRPPAMAWSKFYQGIHLQKAGNDAEALGAFESGLEAYAEGAIGQLLSDAAARLTRESR